MRDVYHCTPEELDRQDNQIVKLHTLFLIEEAKEEKYQEKRNKNISNLKSNVKNV